MALKNRKPSRSKVAPRRILDQHLARIVELVESGTTHKQIIDLFVAQFGFSREAARRRLRDDATFRAQLMAKGAIVDPGPAHRHPCVTPAVVKAVLLHVGDGVDPWLAFETEGIAYRTARRFLRDSPAVRDQIAASRAAHRAKLVHVIACAAKTDWRAAAWLLDRKGKGESWQ